MFSFIILALIFLPGCIHWCSDESNMVLMSIPFAGAMWMWLKAKVHHYRKHKDCDKHK